MLVILKFQIPGKKINVQKWKKIFKIMQNARLLGKLLGNLFEMAGKGDKKASKWLMILYPSIKLLKKKWTTFKILKKQTEKCNINKLKGEIKSIKCNTDSHIQIELKLLSPPAITLNMMSAVLLNPETYNLKGLLWYLKFIKPPLPDSTINLIKDLVRIQNLEPNQKPEINEDNKTIYTINDLKELQPDTGNSILNPDIEITSGWSRSNLGSLKNQ